MQYQLDTVAGGRLLPGLSKISNDGHYSVAVYNNHIAVHSIQSKLKIKSFNCSNLPGIQLDNVIDTFISPINQNLIYLLHNETTDENIIGKISIINWFDNLKNPIISTITLNFNCLKFVKILNLNSNLSHKLNLLVQTSKRKFAILNYNLENNKSNIVKSFENVLNFKLSSNFKNLLLICQINNLKKFKIFQFDDDNNELDSFLINYICPINISNLNSTLAISNDQINPLISFSFLNNGNIIILFDLKSNNPPIKNLKWHIDPPKTLEFNNDQSYLLSGGYEKVLVFWNILNEKQQFLPRLSGILTNIYINYLNPTLINLNLNDIDNDYQFLTLSSIDLLSKLNLNSIHLFNGLNNDNLLIKSFNKDLNSFKKNNSQFTKFKHNFKLNFEINSFNNQIYLKSGRFLQIYDILQNKQIDLLPVIQSLQNYGKVGIEHNLKDPKILNFKILNSIKNKWLITLDLQFDNNSENENIQTLKFWKLIDDKWILQSKILNPHNSNNLITDIIISPLSYFNGESCITCDNKGNLKLWRPNSQNIWSLRKFFSKNSTNNDKISNVLGCWSNDNSIICISNNGSIQLLDINKFELIKSINSNILNSKFHTNINNLNNNKEIFINLNLQNKNIEFIKFSKNDKLLIIQTHNNLSIIDLLKNKCIFGLILSSNKDSGFGGSFINFRYGLNEIDELLIIGKYFNKEGKYLTKISLWNLNTLNNKINCKFIKNYNGNIIGSSFNESWNKWILIDSDSNILELSNPETDSIILNSNNEDNENWIVSNLLDNARIMNKVNNNININNNNNNRDQSNTEEDLSDRVGIQSSTFDNILDNLEGVSVDVLFERVLKVI